MKRLTGMAAVCCLALFGACDPGVSVAPEANGTDVAAKGGAVKNADMGYDWCITDTPENHPLTDMPIPCFTGDADTWTRTVGCLAVEGTRIETPGGRLVINWQVNYDASHYDVYEIDGYGGERVEGGGFWKLARGNQNAHDVANVDDWPWGDDIFAAPYSSGPGLHHYTLHETYEDQATGKLHNLVLPMVFQYDGFDDVYNPYVTAMPTLRRYMQHAFCPGRAHTNG